MPLKSFTNRVFRSGEDAIEQSLETVEEVENLSAKPTREPFRNLPRPRIVERRDERLTNDVSIQTVETSPPSTDFPNVKAAPAKSTDKQLAPVFRSESAFSTSSTKPTAQKPNANSNPPAPVFSSLGVDSTSRRTGDLSSESLDSGENPKKFLANAETTLLDLSTDSSDHPTASAENPPRLKTLREQANPWGRQWCLASALDRRQNQNQILQESQLYPSRRVPLLRPVLSVK